MFYNNTKNQSIKMNEDRFEKNMPRPGADLGGGRGGGRPPPSGIPPPADPKGPPFDTFSEIHFWLTDPKIFLKAPSAPIHTNFEGERAPKKKRDFLSKFFKKCPKTAFLTVFSKICLRRSAQNLAEIGAKQCFGRARKITIWST